jgi:putative glutamine amidotransferase
MAKPRIGITPCGRVDDYVESVKRAGAEPVVLSNGDDPDAALARVDGLLLTGGLDVDPTLYGETPHPKTETAPERDRFEMPLARKAVEHDVPIFAICRGVQVLNVAAGGTLVQDIPSAVRSDVAHTIDVPKDCLAHAVRINPGSRLASAVGPQSRLESCSVNSRHHQAVGNVAPGFVVSAVSPDGVIEGIERPGARFCVGVQWHPENFWRTGEFSGLFAAFVEAARAHKERETLDVRRVGKEVERPQ